jgi:hypothetical protein
VVALRVHTYDLIRWKNENQLIMQAGWIVGVRVKPCHYDIGQKTIKCNTLFFKTTHFLSGRRKNFPNLSIIKCEQTEQAAKPRSAQGTVATKRLASLHS